MHSRLSPGAERISTSSPRPGAPSDGRADELVHGFDRGADEEHALRGAPAAQPGHGPIEAGGGAGGGDEGVGHEVAEAEAAEAGGAGGRPLHEGAVRRR
ncbi:hypothetical protein WMF31_35225 [Sorangium sp. So ce1036]|uniref:hypothetical protein n=1 Tax=Sorangium sp. So ce1036 TaxID=3133328 RepID=UPI003F0CB048